MKRESDDYLRRDILRRHRRKPLSSASNTFNSGFLAELLEKEDEICFYKERLKELEEAFYYNLELISERDLELSVLEKQLSHDSIQLQQVIQERDELEEALRVIDDKHFRKIQQLEARLKVKDDEIKELQRENVTNVTSLKRLLNDVKERQQKKIIKLNKKYEIEKNELIKGYQDELDEKGKYYVLEIDSLTQKLEEMFKEKEKLSDIEAKCVGLKHKVKDLEQTLKEKDKFYENQIKDFKNKRVVRSNYIDQKVQVELNTTSIESQTQFDLDQGKRIQFLQEQNEVLKCVIKDLKKNRSLELKAKGDGPEINVKCVDCKTVKAEVDEVTKKLETEMENIRRILQDEQKQRAEEDMIIKSLESSVICLKDNLLLGLQEKLEEYAGDDICSYTYNREIQNEIKVTLLEQKLTKKIETLISTNEEQRQKLSQKIDELQKECLEKVNFALKTLKNPHEMESENLLGKIRLEIRKLENKIESDMKNIVRNNSEMNKCDKNLQTRLDVTNVGRLHKDVDKLYNRSDDLGKCITVLKHGRGTVTVKNELPRKRIDQRGFRKMMNESMMRSVKFGSVN